MKYNRPEIFSSISSRYELINHLITFGLDMVWRRLAAKQIACASPCMWLDVCSGTGEMAMLLKELTPPGSRGISLDYNLDMLKVSKPVSSVDGVSVSAADVIQLPFSEETFDILTISFATRHMTISENRLRRTLDEFRRVLKTGGKFMSLETTRPDSPRVGAARKWYMKYLAAPLGNFLAGSKTAYGLLADTMAEFMDAATFGQHLKLNGFKNVEIMKMSNGFVAAHFAEK